MKFSGDRLYIYTDTDGKLKLNNRKEAQNLLGSIIYDYVYNALPTQKINSTRSSETIESRYGDYLKTQFPKSECKTLAALKLMGIDTHKEKGLKGRGRMCGAYSNQSLTVNDCIKYVEFIDGKTPGTFDFKQYMENKQTQGNKIQDELSKSKPKIRHSYNRQRIDTSKVESIPDYSDIRSKEIEAQIESLRGQRETPKIYSESINNGVVDLRYRDSSDDTQEYFKKNFGQLWITLIIVISIVLFIIQSILQSEYDSRYIRLFIVLQVQIQCILRKCRVSQYIATMAMLVIIIQAGTLRVAALVVFIASIAYITYRYFIQVTR